MVKLYFKRAILRNNSGIGSLYEKIGFENILSGEIRHPVKRRKTISTLYSYLFNYCFREKPPIQLSMKPYETIYFYKSQKNLLFIIFVPKNLGQIGRKLTHGIKQTGEDGLKFTQEGGVINISGYRLLVIITNEQGFTDKTIPKEVLVLF
ncbi:MAG: hypothetical protein A2536_06390 [Candidatus Firestonebacteria bacterium RIFOXYD2_FULL_39_29]|nr:MAG: hypothetical protein A2536_06390 [Candidatus Firestonebacteria bacterium RIFOXYD2_FULL_39_29]